VSPPGHLALPLAEATPPQVRGLLERAVAETREPGSAHPADGSRLTGREREIGNLVLLGMSSLEIGRQLFISPRTVEKHRANLMEKLHVTNAAALTLELVYQLWGDSAREKPGADRLALKPALRVA
jgi:DNA-binding CsgD family transcriptional regulator